MSNDTYAITNDGRVVVLVNTGYASCHSCVFHGGAECTKANYLTPAIRCGVHVFHEVKDERVPDND